MPFLTHYFFPQGCMILNTGTMHLQRKPLFHYMTKIYSHLFPPAQ